MRYFFAAQVIIFEGQSEEITYNYLKKNRQIDFSKTSVINSYGKFNVEIYINVLNELHIPYTILIDEDSFNPTEFTGEKLQEKKKAYEKTEEIINLIDEQKGRALVVSPDYDIYADIGKNNKSKPTRMYELLQENYETKPNKGYQVKIKTIFNLLNNHQFFKFKAIISDNSEWKKKVL